MSVVDGSPLSTDDVAMIRAQLPVLRSGGRYLNAGTLGPLPQAAIDSMATELRYDIERRQSVDLWDRLVTTCAGARAAVASLTGVGDGQVGLMHSTHEGINAALWGIDWTPGDQIVTTDQEHPAAAVPMRHVRDRAGVELVTVAWDFDDADGDLAARIAAACTSRTRAVVISHVSWLSGAVAPLRVIRDAVPEHVRIIVDGAQSAGILATDLDDGWDAYTVSGQKWPCGPNGTGGIALADPTNWLPMFGGVTQVEPTNAGPYEAPLVHEGRRLEFSQTAMVPLAGLTASVDWLLREIGVERAQAHARLMNRYARTQVEARLGDAPIARLHGARHLLAVELELPDSTPVVRALWGSGIQVSAPIARNRVRFSFGAWTTTDDVDAGIDALAGALAEHTSS